MPRDSRMDREKQKFHLGQKTCAKKSAKKRIGFTGPFSDLAQGRSGHGIRIQQFVDLLFRKQVAANQHILDRSAGTDGCFGNIRRHRITHPRTNGSDDADTVIHQLLAMLLIGGNVADAVVGKGLNAAGEGRDGLKQFIEDHRLKCIEF